MKYVQPLVDILEYREFIERIEHPNLHGLHMNFREHQESNEIALRVVKELDSFFPKSLPEEYGANDYGFEIDVEFKKELAQYLVFSTEFSNEYKKPDKSSTKDYIEETRDILYAIVSAEKDEDGMKHYEQYYTNYTKNLKGSLGVHLKLQENEEATNFIIKHPAWPYISFQCIQYGEGHYVLMKNKLSEKDDKHILQHISLYKKFMTKLTDDLSDVNYFLFEREYNNNLIKSIINADVSHFNEKDNVFKVLSLISLLPNVVGRIQLVNYLCRLPIDKRLSNRKKYKMDSQEESFDVKISIEEEFAWYRVAVRMIIQLAYFTIPVFEVIHSSLFNLSLQSRNRNLDSLYKVQPMIENFFDEPFNEESFSKYDQVRRYIQMNSKLRDSNDPFDFILSLKGEPLVSTDTDYEAVKRSGKIDSLSNIINELVRVEKLFIEELELRY
ncbi:hypothetical protein [Paenibacillus agaridevorans]|uniref:hypothetical protein n=1 Tax=Paenibacillus agaridevorans TaxID=171404 RepID=UPI001BE439C0|nr:hypothetical protein [Paenibacillus agaridevorans]